VTTKMLFVNHHNGAPRADTFIRADQRLDRELQSKAANKMELGSGNCQINEVTLLSRLLALLPLVSWRKKAC
jgi:hypothetical protein